MNIDVPFQGLTLLIRAEYANISSESSLLPMKRMLRLFPIIILFFILSYISGVQKLENKEVIYFLQYNLYFELC